MENNEVKEVREYTDKDVLKMLDRLSEEEMGTLLAFSSVSNIRDILNDKDKYEYHLNNTKLVAYYYNVYANILEGLRDRVDDLLIDDAKDFSADYDKLSDFEKRYVTVNMMNNKEFQKNYWDILEYNFNKIINSDETLSGLSKAFGLSKIFKKILDMNRKSNYRYEVCDERRL